MLIFHADGLICDVVANLLCLGENWLFFFFTWYVLQQSIFYEMVESRNSGGSNLAEGAANNPSVHAQYSQSKSRMGGLERILGLAWEQEKD